MGFRKWFMSTPSDVTRLKRHIETLESQLETEQRRVQIMEIQLDTERLAHEGTKNAYMKAYQETYNSLVETKLAQQWDRVVVNFPLTPEKSDA